MMKKYYRRTWCTQSIWFPSSAMHCTCDKNELKNWDEYTQTWQKLNLAMQTAKLNLEA